MADVNVVLYEGVVKALVEGLGVKLVTLVAVRATNNAKSACPVDTGRLRDSISWELGTGPNGLPAARVGTNVDYAVFVEFGTRYMAAQPFLRTAFEGIKSAYGYGVVSP